MREFRRPPVPCGCCGANIYFNRVGPTEPDANQVIAPRREPPEASDQCPRCGNEVDTTSAYAAIADFPPRFDAIKAAYADFVPHWEHARGSFELMVKELLDEGNTTADLGAEFSEGDGWAWYRQRLFYRSCTAFYRSLQLFFAYLSLERRCFQSWASVTGYYSRFFFLQALLNLMLTTFDAELKHLFYFNGARVQCVSKNKLSPTLSKAPSHEAWWQLMEAIKIPRDFPFEHTEFVLSRLAYSPQSRNNVNYGFEYLKDGFIELDWFDSGAKQLLSHLNPCPRPDRDFTDIDRFFEGCDPENCDDGGFYSDDAHTIWCSIKTYLEMLAGLDFKQSFVLVENVAALAEIHLSNDYPKLMKGILIETEKVLKQGFDVEKFMADREANPDRLSSFYGAVTDAYGAKSRSIPVDTGS